MQELALIRPSDTEDTELLLEPKKIALKREFDECLAECEMLAFWVARGVLHNGSDAEDVAQEAMMQAYRWFKHLRDRSWFRAWLVRITFRRP
jgi:DNA-directed RNA polymerase specialized sigma24 family protein